MSEDTEAKKRQLGRLRITEHADWAWVEEWIDEQVVGIRAKLEEDRPEAETMKLRAGLREWKVFREAFNAEGIRRGLSETV